MKTEELIALGITEDQAKSILVINGKDIEATKTKFGDYDSIKSQLTERDKDIESLKSSKGNADELQTKLSDLQTKYTADTEKLSKEKSDMQFNHILDGALTGSKAKSTKAVKALLEMDGLKLNGEDIVGLKEQLEKIKTDNGYLFEDETLQPQLTAGTGHTPPADDMASVRAAMGLPPQTK